MTEFERYINDEKAVEFAERIKNYCKLHKSCRDDKCRFWTGVCALQHTFPSDWDINKNCILGGKQ